MRGGGPGRSSRRSYTSAAAPSTSVIMGPDSTGGQVQARSVLRIGVLGLRPPLSQSAEIEPCRKN